MRLLRALAVSVALMVALAASAGGGGSTASDVASRSDLRARAAGAGGLNRLEHLSLQGQAVISSAVGAGDSRFGATRDSAGLRFAGGGVDARFSRGGLVIDAGGESLSMQLTGVGRGGRLAAVGAVAPRARSNRVSYAHPGGLREWYAAGPLGIEQGFDVARRPAGESGPLALRVALGGSLRAERAGTGLAFVSDSGRMGLRYGGLSAVDSTGRRLRARLEPAGSTLLLRVADRGARYPLHIDPLIQDGSKLVGSGGSAGSEQGSSVAVSADGNTALVGGPRDGLDGAAWVFVRLNGTWTQQAKLVGSGGTGASQGRSVALSADGNTALVGGPGADGNVGAAWVFVRSGGAWTQQGPKLVGSGATIPQFTGGGPWQGDSVALSPDGGTALVGGPNDNGGVGATWVFARSGTTWTQQGSKLVGTGATGDAEQGSSVAVSSLGNFVLVGGPFDNNGAGAAWVFARSGSSWIQQGSKLVGMGASGGARQGFGVALSTGGDTALVGGPFDNNGVGAAWVFARSGSAWAQQGSKLVGSGASGAARQGQSVALSQNGTTVVIGGPADSTNRGAAWAFCAQAPALTSGASATFKTGQPSSFTVRASGCPTPVLSESGGLPAGVSFSENGDGTATVSGTPESGSGGSYDLTFTASNGAGPSASQRFTLTVQQPPAITSGASTTFKTGEPGSFTVTTTGFPSPALSLGGGSLPSGVSFTDNGDGTATVSGTPAAGSTATHEFTITASNGVSPAASQSFTLTVGQPPGITSGTSTTFKTGEPGNFTVTTSGFPTTSISAGGGSLPAGVGFTDNGDGTATLSGTPAAGSGGSYHLTINAVNGVAPNASQSFTLRIDQPPALISAASTTFMLDQFSSFTVTATGFPTPSLSGPGASLPPGMSFADNGDGTATLSGIPAAGSAGSYRFTITASNGVTPDAIQSFTLTVGQPSTPTGEPSTPTGEPSSPTPAAFGARTLVTLKLAARRVPARGPLKVLVTNANGFPVTGKVSGRGADRVSVSLLRRPNLAAESFRLTGHARKTVKLSLPKALRRELSRKHRLSLRLVAKVKDPAGHSRSVKKRVTPRLRGT